MSQMNPFIFSHAIQDHIYFDQRKTVQHTSHLPHSRYMPSPNIQYFIKIARFQYHHSQWQKCLDIPSCQIRLSVLLLDPFMIRSKGFYWGGGEEVVVPLPHRVTQ